MSHLPRFARWCLAAAWLALTACNSGQSPPDSTANPARAKPPAIAWFDGSVEEAFAVSEDTGKPLFLFWHAKWCGACDNVRANVFTRPDFIERTAQFVAVALDVDDRGAQRWGEHYGMLGTPTMIVFRPDRTEVVRLSGGVRYQQYARTLDAALQASESLQSLLVRARTEPDAIAASDWERLANHAWNVDAGRTVAEDRRIETFEELARASPDPVWRTRFQVLALAHRTAAADAPAQALDAERRAAARGLLQRVLADAAAREANRNELVYYGPAMLHAAAPDEQDRAPLRTALLDYTRSLRGELGFNSYWPELKLHRLEAPEQPIPKSLENAIRDQIRKALAEASTPVERQIASFTGGYLLLDLGYPEEAEARLAAGIEAAVDPKYHYEFLAKSCEQRGAPDEALAWQKRGWEAANGPTTFLHAGTIYVDMLVRLRPDEPDAIDAAMTDLLDGLAMHPDAYYARGRYRLAKLAKVLQPWARESNTGALLLAWQRRLNPVCETVDEGDGLRSGCRAMFVESTDANRQTS